MVANEKFLEILNLLESSRVKDKKIAFESLEHMLNQPQIVEALHRHSSDGNKEINWELLFIRAHKAIIAEVDRADENKKKLPALHVEIYTSRIIHIVKTSICRNTPMINCNTIISNILSIFEVEARKKFLAATYLDMLQNYIIPHRKHWGEVKCKYWTELKNMCQQLYFDPPNGISSNVIFLEILSEIVRIRCKNSTNIHKFVDLFSFLNKLYSTKQNNPPQKFQIVLLRMTNILCRQLAVECRFQVCEFMEEIFDFVMSFHEHKKSDKNLHIYHFFATTLSVHNPNGSDEKNSLAYATDWRKWKNQIKDIYSLCYSELKGILKDSEKAEVSPVFLDLIVDVTRLVIIFRFNQYESTSWASGVESSYSQPGPSNKRKRSSDFSSQSTPISMKLPSAKLKQIKLDCSLGNILPNLLTPDAWFWLKFLEVYLQKYSNNSTDEFQQILGLLTQLIENQTDEKIVKGICRCLCVLLNVESNQNFRLDYKNSKLVNEHWCKIKECAFRSFQAHAFPEHYLLIKSLSAHGKIEDSSPFLDLYRGDLLEPSLENFSILLTICRSCVLPDLSNSEHDTDVRSLLLEWLTHGLSKYPSKDLVKVFIALMLKRSEDINQLSIIQGNRIRPGKKGEDFFKSVINSYLTVNLKNLKFLEEEKSQENYTGIKFDIGTKNRVISWFIIRCDSLLSDLNDESFEGKDIFKIICDSLHFCELVFYLFSFFKELNLELSSEDDDLISRAETLTLLVTTKSYDSMEKGEMINLAPFSNFYKCQFNLNFSERIRHTQCTNMDFLKKNFKILETFGGDFHGVSERKSSGSSNNSVFNSPFNELVENKSPLHENKFSPIEKSVINAVEVLCQFIVVPGASEANQYQIVLSEKLLQVLNKCGIRPLMPYFHFHLVLRVLYNFTKYDAIGEEVLENSLVLLAKIHETMHSDIEIVIIVLHILKEMTHLVDKSDSLNVQSKFLKIIAKQDTIMEKKTCGPKAALKFIECLTEIAKYDLNGGWAVNDKKNRVFENIILYLKYPCNEVRLCAAQSVGVLFTLSKDIKESPISWQGRMLNLILDTLKSIKATEDEYSNIVTGSASLIAFANITCSSSYWRKPSLFFMLNLIVVNKIPKRQVEEIFQVISKELKITRSGTLVSRNFHYLFNKWIEKKYAMEVFPYYLLDCDTMEEFYSRYSNTIVSIYLVNGQKMSVKTLCSNLGKSFTSEIENCLPNLFALILPYMNENIRNRNIENVQEIKLTIKDLLKPKTVEKVLEEKAEEVIGIMIKNFNDAQYLKILCDGMINVNEQKTQFSYNLKEIKESLQNLSLGDKSLLGSMILEKPSAIQKILFDLSKEIWLEVTYEDRIMSLCKYFAFAEMISGEANKQAIFRRFNAFFVREVVNTLILVIRKDDSADLTVMACRFVITFFKYYLDNFPSTLGEFLPAITSVIVPLMKNRHEEAQQVLIFFVCDNYGKLKNEISLLDPLPSEEIFSEANSFVLENRDAASRPLESEIRRFLDAGKSKTSGCRLEGLKHLHQMLSDRKEELKKMFDSLCEMRGFSEDCSQSLIHQLICMLVEISFDQNLEVKSETAKCLGELGPADLTTLVLQPKSSSSQIQNYEKPLNRLLKSSLITLSNSIISENYVIKDLGAESLRLLLSTPEGNRIVDNQELPPNVIDYLTPFRLLGQKSLQLRLEEENFLKHVDIPDLWLSREHTAWITNLVKAILKSLKDEVGLIPAFCNLVDVHWEFAESIFPILIDLFLSLKKEIYKKVISGYVNRFFVDHFDSERKANQWSLQCMLDTVDYVRLQRSYEGIYNKSVIEVDYLYIARAALSCSAFFTAILYAELWYQDKKSGDESLDIDGLCEKYPEEGRTVTKVLRECYSKIGISDAIHGCGYNHLLDPSSEIQHYEHLKKWNLSMLHNDIEISRNPKSSKFGLVEALLRSGMFYTANSLLQSDKELVSIRYKCAAKLGDWSIFDEKKQETCYEKCRYFAIKAFRDEDFFTFFNKVDKARDCVMMELTSCSLECSKNVYLPLALLRCLKESEDLTRAIQKGNLVDLELLYNKWQSQDEIKQNEFKLVEAIMNQRCTMLKLEMGKSKNPDAQNYLKSVLCEIYLKLIKTAREQRHYETALRNLSELNGLENLPENIAAESKLEKARISWESGEKNVGKFLLSRHLEGNEIRGELKAKGLRLYGDWMAETRSENSQKIIENYYLESLNASSDENNIVDTYASLAKFAYYNYHQLLEYLSSPALGIKQDLISTHQNLETGEESDAERRRAAYLARKQSAIDESEIRQAIREKEEFLNLALKYYLLVLKHGEKYDLLIFRVVSLWMSNPGNMDLHVKLKEMLPQIPSYKFLCILPQILPRMTKMQLVETIIGRTLQEHPHHTLPLLFALEKSLEDAKYMTTVKSVSSNERSECARRVLSRYQKTNDLKVQIVEMNRFCSALIEFAHETPDSTKRMGTPITIPKNLQITRLKRFSTLMVPTLDLPYRKNCDYRDVVKLLSFDEAYENVGGVNAPKKIDCTGTDGRKRTLLVKGKDDLRQDAVMQQVFTIMNSLLQQNAETKKRKLVIRTYKVIPLSQRSGIIEWCLNTQPLSIYLIGKNQMTGAHGKFNPSDITAQECRLRLRNAAERKASNREKLSVYLDICKNFRPAFHNYFIENFPSAGIWFERRLAYTLSVAASSMIGYILGIGDRHVHNILIDNMTAEIIHIDLGIAFDQGKSLPTPEMVPFRLTRDIVDGMGLSGVEGVFRSGCVKTMEVLRNNQDTVLTLLEVLLYDPLYSWAITPEKAISKQSDSTVPAPIDEKFSPDMEVNKMAERALINLKQKLQGTEDGVPTNVEGQVNYLIQQARDPNNLSRMFHGWQAYL